MHWSVIFFLAIFCSAFSECIAQQNNSPEILSYERIDSILIHNGDGEVCAWHLVDSTGFIYKRCFSGKDTIRCYESLGKANDSLYCVIYLDTDGSKSKAIRDSINRFKDSTVWVRKVGKEKIYEKMSFQIVMPKPIKSIIKEERLKYDLSRYGYSRKDVTSILMHLKIFPEREGRNQKIEKSYELIIEPNQLTTVSIECDHFEDIIVTLTRFPNGLIKSKSEEYSPADGTSYSGIEYYEYIRRSE